MLKLNLYHLFDYYLLRTKKTNFIKRESLHIAEKIKNIFL